MPKLEEQQPVEEAGADQWIKRLTDLIDAVEKMGPRERHAALVYLKSRYAKDWPTDNY